MHIGFLNPQGNFDPKDSHWTEHPDFGGQLVYVKAVAIAMAKHGHHVDILTRQIIDPEWPEFANPFDGYSNAPNVRIIRLPAGPIHFLRKELLWPHLVSHWVPNVVQFYKGEGSFPDIMTAHYGDGGLCGVLIEDRTGIPFTFTAHSLGAQKMDKLHVTPENLKEKDDYFYFGRRLVAERLSMNRSAVNITNTELERFEQYTHFAYRGAVDVDNSARFAAISPGVDPEIFEAESRAENEEAIDRHIQDYLARDIAEERRDYPAIVSSSRLDPKKNLPGLVKAFAQSQTLQNQANLVFFTRGQEDPLREKVNDEIAETQVLIPVRQTIEKHKLWGKVSAFPIANQTALAAAYRFFAQRRSVFTLPSHHEPFGLSPIEAAVAGLPVVATQNGGIRESLRVGDEEFAIFVNPEDPTDIAQGLEKVLGNSQIWEDLEQRARQRILKNFTWESTAVDYLNLLEKIVRDSQPPRQVDLLPIHPYFHDPKPENDVSLQELGELYFGKEGEKVKKEEDISV